MKSFSSHDLKAALEYAREGGQALHLHRISGGPRIPRCFRAALNRGEQIAHLFDMDETRLIATAKRLGVRVILVERKGTDRQHIDLCATPLRNAIAESGEES